MLEEASEKLAALHASEAAEAAALDIP